MVDVLACGVRRLYAEIKRRTILVKILTQLFLFEKRQVAAAIFEGGGRINLFCGLYRFQLPLPFLPL